MSPLDMRESDDHDVATCILVLRRLGTCQNTRIDRMRPWMGFGTTTVDLACSTSSLINVLLPWNSMIEPLAGDWPHQVLASIRAGVPPGFSVWRIRPRS